MKVAEIMTSDVFSVTQQQSLNEAAQLMWEHDIGSVPVLGDDNQVVAMLTDRDIAMASYLNGSRLDHIPVSIAESRQVVCCKPDDEMGTVENLMQENQIRRIPVIGESAELLGIVSLNDLACAYSTNGKTMKSKELSDTLAGICKHTPQGSPLATAA